MRCLGARGRVLPLCHRVSRGARFFISLLLLATASLSAAAQSERLTVGVDPRVELLSAALTQTVWSPALKGFFSPYAQDCQKTFFPFRNHAAVKQLNALHARGVELAELFVWITSRSQLPSLEATGGADPVLVKRARGAEALDKLASALSALYTDSKFEAFQLAHSAFYSQLSSRLAGSDGLSISSIDALETYTGIKRERYSVVVAPLLGNASFSWTGSGDRTAFAIIAPSALRGESLAFDPTSIGRIVPVGFGRSVGQEIVSSRPSRSAAHSEWFGYLDERLRALNVTTWDQALAEGFASVIAIRLLEQRGRVAEAATMKRSVMSHGVVWLPYLLERIGEYDANRTRYPSLREFADRLFDALDELEPVLLEGEPVDLGLSDVWLTEDGLPVKSVAPGSPAQRAGIRAGDLILSIGGVTIRGSESYLKAWDRWEQAKNGALVPMRVKRGKASFLSQVQMRKSVQFQGLRKRLGGG